MVSENDKKLWNAFTKGVNPLKKREKAYTSTSAADPALKRNAASSASTPSKALASPETQKRPVPIQSFDPREFKKLSRGKMPIDATLDLHGMTQPQAHRALKQFILSCHTSNKKRVLIITGKGRAGGEGILRTQLPKWLHMADLIPYIVSFKNAHGTHGGTGALYIRLRGARSKNFKDCSQ